MSGLDRRGFLATIAAALALPLLPKEAVASPKAPAKIKGASMTMVGYDESEFFADVPIDPTVRTWWRSTASIVEDLEWLQKELATLGYLHEVEHVFLSTQELGQLENYLYDLLSWNQTVVRSAPGVVKGVVFCGMSIHAWDAILPGEMIVARRSKTPGFGTYEYLDATRAIYRSPA